MTEKRKYADRAQANILAVAKRRKRVREMAVEKLGGKCQVCGYNRCQSALDFHHKDESQKSFGISSKGYTRSWDSIRTEVDKCFLLCANCHREVHTGVLQLSAEKRIEKQGELSRKGFHKVQYNVGQEALAKQRKIAG